MKKIIIAIDGYSSCGKSTLAKSLAKELDYIYIDTGAMYRAVTFYALNHEVSPENIGKHLSEISISFKNIDGNIATFLNGENVESNIRTLKVSDHVSDYSAIKNVRDKLVEQQQVMGQKKGVVLDGRDIGTVVFPNAELKIFMTADTEVRAQRRYDELTSKGQSVSFEEVKLNLLKRDFIDTTRKESPLVKADDAIVLDNTNLSIDEQLKIAKKWALELMQS